MKKLIVLPLAGALALSVGACAKSSTDADNAAAATDLTVNEGETITDTNSAALETGNGADAATNESVAVDSAAGNVTGNTL